jgi:hypothetical protein
LYVDARRSRAFYSLRIEQLGAELVNEPDWLRDKQGKVCSIIPRKHNSSAFELLKLQALYLVLPWQNSVLREWSPAGLMALRMLSMIAVLQLNRECSLLFCNVCLALLVLCFACLLGVLALLVLSAVTETV